jgi:hypothetical protein
MKKNIKKLQLKKKAITQLNINEKQLMRGGDVNAVQNFGSRFPDCKMTNNTCLCMTFAECEPIIFL